MIGTVRIELFSFDSDLMLGVDTRIEMQESSDKAFYI